MYAHKRKDVQTHTGTRVFLSSSCLERMPPKPIPRGSWFEWKAFMANTVWIQNTFLAGWARACEKQIVSIQISLFSISFSAWERTIGMSPGRTQFGYWPFFKIIFIFLWIKMDLLASVHIDSSLWIYKNLNVKWKYEVKESNPPKVHKSTVYSFKLPPLYLTLHWKNVVNKNADSACITKSLQRQISHQSHQAQISISRKILIRVKATRINSFTVKSQLVDP